MTPMRVLILGGYGFFGARLAERLARQDGLHLILAGRSAERARTQVAELGPAAASTLEALSLDLCAPDFPAQLARISPQVVVHTSGPFQGQDYRVAQACIDGRVHYVDLADGRAFVAGIEVLDADARRAGVAVISGASSVPALSSAAADWLARGLAQVELIDIGISPGNRTERGLATMEAVLSYCGQPLPGTGDAAMGPWGWSGVRSHRYPAPVGSRLLSPCDVPDLALLPARYAGHPEVRFGAGLELRLLHRAMNVMAWMTRRGLVTNWAAHARPLKRIADLVRHLGSDAGAMHVAVTGRAPDGNRMTRQWQLLALEGDGPYVPTLAAAALVRKLRDGDTALAPGARACLGMLSLEDFAREAQGLRIAFSTTPADP